MGMLSMQQGHKENKMKKEKLNLTVDKLERLFLFDGEYKLIVKHKSMVLEDKEINYHIDPWIYFSDLDADNFYHYHKSVYEYIIEQCERYENDAKCSITQKEAIANLMDITAIKLRLLRVDTKTIANHLL